MQTIRTKTGYQLDNIHVDAKPFSRLPTQQARTLLFVAQGLPQKTIAKLMGVNVCTVKQACGNLSFKFNTQTMRQTVHQATKQGVLRYTLVMLLCVISAANDHSQRTFKSARINRTIRTTKNRSLNAILDDFLIA